MYTQTRSNRSAFFALSPLAIAAIVAWHPVQAATSADVTTGGTLRFDSKSVAANGTLLLADADSFLKSNGKCAFNLGYDMRNQGGSDSGVFLNRVYMDNQLVAINSNLSLTAGQGRAIITQPYLTPGSHTVKLVLDADNQVAESDENNNTISVNVRVDSTCGASVPTAPSQPDLTSRVGVAIGGTAGGAGGVFSAWGGQIAVKASDAFAQSGGKCAFNLNYDLENAGAATQQNFADRLYSGTALVGQQTGLTLGAQEARQIMTQAYLMPGAQVLTLQIDPEHVSNDSNWQNNYRSMTVTVDGRCDGAVTTPPAKPAITSAKGLSLGGSTSGAGGQFAAWGGKLTVHDADAAVIREGKCGYVFNYDLENIGSGATRQPFTARLYDGSNLLAAAGGLTMAAGSSRNLIGLLGLAPGHHALNLVVDPNVAAPTTSPRTVDVTVDAQCRSK